MHGDHMDGAAHLGDAPVLVNADEIAYSRTAMARFFQRVLRQPIPAGVRFESMRLDGGPFGAFAASKPLSEDGRVIVVATPGHTPGHVSVVCIDDDGNHVLIAGDATDSVEQLHARRPDAVGPKPAVTVATIDRIRDHAAQQPTVFLPSHDPESVARLTSRTTL
jgi:glyoxylase-like metal-dependent hydrolase (beta-lactamase superfamily II)